MEKRKSKFTIIDLFIILIVLAVLAFGVMKIVPSIGKVQTNQKVEFTVLISGKDTGFSESMNIGDNVVVSLEEKDSGIIKDIKTQTAQTMTFNSIDGAYTNETLDDKEDIYVTVESAADISDSAISIGNTLVKVGAEVPVRGKGYATFGYIIEIND